jgi:hypothetical protein
VLDDRIGAAAAAVDQLACLEHGTEPVANKSELTKRCLLRIGGAIAAAEAPAWMKGAPGGQRTPLEMWEGVAAATKHRMSGRQLAGLYEGLRGQEQQRRERAEAKRQVLALQASEVLPKLHRLVLQSRNQLPASFPLQRLLRLLHLGAGDDAVERVVAAQEDVERLPKAVRARGRAALELASDVVQQAAALAGEEDKAAGQAQQPEGALLKHRATWTGQLVVQEHGAVVLRWCWPQRPSPHPGALTDAAAGGLPAMQRYTGACKCGAQCVAQASLQMHDAVWHCHDVPPFAAMCSKHKARGGRLPVACPLVQCIRPCSCHSPACETAHGMLHHFPQPPSPTTCGCDAPGPAACRLAFEWECSVIQPLVVAASPSLSYSGCDTCLPGCCQHSRGRRPAGI